MRENPVDANNDLMEAQAAEAKGPAEFATWLNNKVVGKDQITLAWADDRGEAPAAAGMIEVYIHRLRRKLEGSGVGIRTV